MPYANGTVAVLGFTDDSAMTALVPYAVEQTTDKVVDRRDAN